jgi:hypothetical protein
MLTQAQIYALERLKLSQGWLREKKDLREKEGLPVERGLEKIRRARELGKTTVKLSQAELDALDRTDRRPRLYQMSRLRSARKLPNK